MTKSLEELSHTWHWAHPAAAMAAARVRMVVGVTSPQTCLVLTGRLRALERAGFEVSLVASPGELLETTAKSEGVSHQAIVMERGIAPLMDMLSFVALLRLLWREQPEVTDFSTPKAGLLGNLAAWLLMVPHRVYTLRGLKLESSSGWKRMLLLGSERLAAACADVVLCNSESLRAEALVLGIAPAKKLHVLGAGSSNGVDVKRFQPGTLRRRAEVRGGLGFDENSLVLGFVGRLTRDKGVPELLKAFDEILFTRPDAWLLLVGWFDASEDALEAEWHERVKAHPRIRHTGFVADVAPYYHAMDLMVLPTHREGFPNVVLEAAASGVPVITTESTGARDAVVPEVTGMLIPIGNAEAIVEAVEELARNAAKRARMRIAARSWAEGRYSQEKVLGLAVEFYRRLAGMG